jgi:hypothetical protein
MFSFNKMPVNRATDLTTIGQASGKQNADIVSGLVAFGLEREFLSAAFVK